jgi:transposase
MASKGQKFNQYTPEFRNEIVLQYLNENKSYGYLANVYGISKKTIETWVRKYKQGNSLMSDNRGRPKKEEDIDYKERYEILKNYQAFLKAQREKK